MEGPRGHLLETAHPCQLAARPGTRMQETDQVQMTLICRGNPKGPTGMFCRTVHNGAVQRVKHLSTPIIMARMLDAVSGSAESGSTSEQRMEEHNPQPYRLASGAGPASRTLMVARSATRMPLLPSCAAGARTGPTVLLDDAFRCACAGGRGSRIAALRCFACSFEVVARILPVGAVAPSLGI